MEIRPVRTDEFDDVGELVVTAYRQLPDGTHSRYERVLRDVAARAAAADVLVAVDDEGRLLGSVTYVGEPGPYAESEDPDEATIRMLAVAPATQGRGIGTELVSACIDLARVAGRRRIGLVSRPSMLAAHRVYDRLGFRRDAGRDFVGEDGTELIGYSLDLAGG